jgi:hypothetical protein
MRIAVLFHAHHLRDEVEHDYVVSVLANLWRDDGHEVRFLIGRDWWPADVAILHVDLSRVPRRYVTFARRYPVALNQRLIDIRKSAISTNLVGRRSPYQGPVIVKTNLNSAGIPERKLLSRGRWHRIRARLLLRRADQPLEYVKRYAVYESFRAIPADVLARGGTVVERFRAETEGEWYFTRRCFVLGERAISYRMGDTQPFVEAGKSFEWIENCPEVLAVARQVGLDFGVIDYTLHDGEVAVFDVNKTVGIGRMLNDAARRDYDRILGHLAPGLYPFVQRGGASSVQQGGAPAAP